MNDFTDIENLLAPRVEARASARLRARIQAIDNRRRRRWWPLGVAASTAVAAVLCALIFIPVVKASVTVGQLIDDAVTLLGGNFTIRMEVRTTPQENFAHLDTSLAPIPVTMSVNGCEWRIDKGGLVACGNDTLRYEWSPGKRLGLRSVRGMNVIEGFGLLINPKAMLMSEDSHDSAAMTREGGRITLTARHGEETRLYTFDAVTHRLIDYRVTVAGVEVVRTTSITTGTARECMAQPQGIVWRDIDFVSGIGPGRKPGEVASHILSSLRHWDNKGELERAFIYYDLEALRDIYLGARLVRMGNPYTAPSHGSHVFVPYTLLMPNGRRFSSTLSLVPADDEGWVVDGGI